jgi:5-methylcytosine-specific restriction endonuclease McrA
MKRKPLSRDENGMIKNICTICGTMRLSRQKKLKPLCKSCGIKKSFTSRPAVGLKTINNIDRVIKEYQSGKSLQSLGKQYGVSAMTIRAKIIENGMTTRNYSESSKRTKTILKAHGRIRELCKTGEFQRNMSARLQGVPIEEWKGFTTSENKRLVASPEYREWQRSVFKRDQHTCQLCNKTNCPIAAHHIYMKAKYPDKALDVNNGITLCSKCHHKTIGHEDEYIDLFVSWLNLLAQPPVW